VANREKFKKTDMLVSVNSPENPCIVSPEEEEKGHDGKDLQKREV